MNDQEKNTESIAQRRIMENTIITVPDSLFKPINEFIRDEKLPLEAIITEPGHVRIIKADPDHECDVKTLWVGGWISCPTAHQLAGRLGIKPIELSKLLTFLDIKVKLCQLGLF